MITLITIVIILACAILGFFILIQNPKGGGLQGSFGNMSTQALGVKQSGDIMEKGTWVLMGTVAALCIVSVMFMQVPESATDNSKKATPTEKQAPAKKK